MSAPSPAPLTVGSLFSGIGGIDLGLERAGMRVGSQGREGGDNLRTQVGGSLNPTWVEWLMGFPPGWTDLDASATPSSPRSPSTSDASS